MKKTYKIPYRIRASGGSIAAMGNEDHVMSRLDVVRAIIADCEADVKKREGQAFTGENVAAYFGETLAMLQALARVVESILVDGQHSGETF